MEMKIVGKHQEEVMQLKHFITEEEWKELLVIWPSGEINEMMKKL